MNTYKILFLKEDQKELDITRKFLECREDKNKQLIIDIWSCSEIKEIYYEGVDGLINISKDESIPSIIFSENIEQTMLKLLEKIVKGNYMFVSDFSNNLNNLDDDPDDPEYVGYIPRELSRII